jgi:integrase
MLKLVSESNNNNSNEQIPATTQSVSTEQAKDTELSIPKLRWKALYALVYTGGLRYGEMLNLTWRDIDLKKGHVAIRNRIATETMPPFYVKDNEKRTVPLPSQILKIL